MIREERSAVGGDHAETVGRDVLRRRSLARLVRYCTGTAVPRQWSDAFAFFCVCRVAAHWAWWFYSEATFSHAPEGYVLTARWPHAGNLRDSRLTRAQTRGLMGDSARWDPSASLLQRKCAVFSGDLNQADCSKLLGSPPSLSASRQDHQVSTHRNIFKLVWLDETWAYSSCAQFCQNYRIHRFLGCAEWLLNLEKFFHGPPT